MLPNKGDEILYMHALPIYVPRKITMCHLYLIWMPTIIQLSKSQSLSRKGISQFAHHFKLALSSTVVCTLFLMPTWANPWEQPSKPSSGSLEHFASVRFEYVTLWKTNTYYFSCLLGRIPGSLITNNFFFSEILLRV